MAEAQLTTELTELSPVPETFIARVASCTFWRNLEQFATTLLGLTPAQYYRAINNAKQNVWNSCTNVLKIWYNRTALTVRDLRIMLKEAEVRGFVEKGACDLVLNGTKPAYLTSGQMMLYPELASILRSWYKGRIWGNLSMFPWMGDERALMLSEVYTQMEMESYQGRDRKRIAIPLNDYKELFKNMRPEGNRILIKGDPGIGKTTFTHEVAHDWATGNLPQFDLVLVLKLKFNSKEQTIENMVAEQLQSISDTPNPVFSDSTVRKYLKSGKDRILLVLDGLDEIKLKEYQHVQEVLRGDAYRKCCIIATTRPHVAASFHNKATSVAKILGFSREKAEEFTSHIISNESEKKIFFQQIYEKNMSKMVSVPILVQALALLFRENKQLPENYKTTYDELVLYLRKTCEDSKGLTEEEIREAMNEISILAFRGLTREDRQLVFSRDEIQNENIMKLGLLAAEKTGTGFRPTIVLYFLHTTLQNYCASDHVTKELENGNRESWEMLIEDLHKDQNRDPWETVIEELGNRQQEATGLRNTSSKEPKPEEKKTKPTVKVRPNQVGVVGSLIRKIEPLYALSIDQFSEARSVLGKIHPRFMKNESPHMYASLFRKMNSLLMKNDLWLSRTPHLLKHFSAILKLLEKLSEPLFIFIMGKLALYNLELIIAEITELILRYSFDETTGSMLYLHNIRDGIEEYVKGKRPKSENTAIDEILMKNSAVLDFTQPFEDSYCHLARQPRFAALRVAGTGGEDDSDFLLNINGILKTRNIHSAELDDLSFVANGEVRSEFADALCQSLITCLELFNLDPLITKALLGKLPETVRYLSICQGCDATRQTEPYPLLSAEHLSMLYLENCAIDLSQASFPNLIQLIVDRVSVPPENAPAALIEALSRMSKLEYLGMYRCRMTSLGPSLVKLLQKSTLKDVILNDCNLSAEDGEQILESIQDGKLDHITSLRLIGHKNLTELEQRFVELCHEHDIQHQISAETLFDMDNLTNKNKSVSETEQQEPNKDYQQDNIDVTSLEKLLTDFIQIQVEEFHHNNTTSLSNMIPERVQAAVASISNAPPELLAAITTGFSNMTPEWLQTVTTGLSNMTPEYIKTVTAGFSNTTPEQLKTVMATFSNITPEEMETAITGFSNMTPEQVQTRITGISNSTPEQWQTVRTGFSNWTPEQWETTITEFSNTSQEKWETLFSGFSNMTPGQMESAMNAASNVTPELMQTMMETYSNMTPEQMQTMMTRHCNKSPEQMETTITRLSNMTPEQWQTAMTRFNEMTPEQRQTMTTDPKKADSKESLCAPGATGSEPARNDTAQTTDIFENPVRSRDRPETQANDTRQPQFDFRTIRNLLPGICSTYNSENPAETQQPREDSQQDDRQSHGEQKRDDHVDDLDLD